MKAIDVKMHQVLGGAEQHAIPVFQRNYEWTKKEWKTLWTDISTVYDEKDPKFSHFLGPIVVMSHSLPYDAPILVVIDGQQRLMTLTLLLIALRDYARAVGVHTTAKTINDYYITFPKRGDVTPKLIPRLRDRETLYNLIFGRHNVIDKNSLLWQAYAYFYEELETLTPLQGELFATAVLSMEEVVERLQYAIAQRLWIVSITLDSNDNPSRIYESLNYKQAKLSDGDLIRNYVFMQIKSTDEQETFEQAHWRPFEEQFEKLGAEATPTLTDFFYRYLISKKQYFALERVYSVLTAYLGDILERGSLAGFVTELRKFARYYLFITLECPDDELELEFQRFRKLETKTAIPLLLFLYDKYQSEDDTQRLSKSAFVTMIRDIESFILRRFILRERGKGYGEDFAGAIPETTTPERLRRYFAHKGWPTDEQVREALLDFDFYARSSVKAKLVLVEIERAYGHKERVDYDKLSIEHVLPRNLTERWREMLGPEADSVHERIVHTLGNLTLTGYNSELGDRPYAEKRHMYASSNVSMNGYFADYDVWTEKEIQGRTLQLANRLIDFWGRPAYLQQDEPLPRPRRRNSQKGDDTPKLF